MRLLILAAAFLATATSAHAEVAIYTGQGDLGGNVSAGMPGDDLRQRWVVEYSGPMRVSLEETIYHCDEASSPGQKLTLAGTTLEDGTWLDLDTGDAGEARGHFWADYQYDDIQIGCWREGTSVGLGPVHVSNSSLWGDPFVFDHSIEGNRLTVNLSSIDEHNVGALDVEFVGTRTEILLTVNPRTINLASNGRHLTARLSPDGSLSPEEFDLESFQLEGVNASRAAIEGGAVIIKFPRQAVADQLTVSPTVPVMLMGRLIDGLSFSATDTIAVIGPPDERDPAPRFAEEAPAISSVTTAPREYLRAVPNPFNPSTTISFRLDNDGHVALTIYDLAGRRVKTLISGHIDAGGHEAQWDGRDEQGRLVASGVYLYRLVAGEFNETKRMVLLK